MTSNTTAGHDPSELGELERSILSVVWRKSEVTAEQVREELGRPLKDSTIRTVLRRLEEKGYLEHSLENRTFLYRPAESRNRVAGRAVKRTRRCWTALNFSAWPSALPRLGTAPAA